MLFEANEHEPLTTAPFDASTARAFVREVVHMTDAAFDPAEGWPLHPEDRSGDESAAYAGIYCGAAGTMWALTTLARAYDVELRHDYADEIVKCEERYRRDPAETSTVVPSYFLGTVGIMLARYAIAGDRTTLERILADMRANLGNPTREVLWGSPGTAIAGVLIRERDGDHRFDDVLRAVQDELWETWEPARGDDGLLWEQDMYGERRRYVGAGHGAIGNLTPFLGAMDLLGAERRAVLRERLATLLEAYVMRDGDSANWYSLGEPRFGMRMQWCHGSPGVVIGLARYPTNDDRVETLLVQGGNGIWKAGPLRKGPTLCHGTAGNGFAFLRLAERTGDDAWLHRAQRFAAHAMEQVAGWRATFGTPSFSLWTGELGVALYVDAVLNRDPRLLTLDSLG